MGLSWVRFGLVFIPVDEGLKEFIVLINDTLVLNSGFDRRNIIKTVGIEKESMNQIVLFYLF